jgi:hypothetical protein
MFTYFGNPSVVMEMLDLIAGNQAEVIVFGPCDGFMSL